MNLVCRQEL